MAEPFRITRSGAQLIVTFDDGSRRFAQPTGQGLWLLSGGDDPNPPDPEPGGRWMHPLGKDWPTGKWTTYPGSADHAAGAVDFGTGYGGTPPLYAPCNGKVIYNGLDAVGNPDLTIQPAGESVGITYLHMNRIDVAVGATVRTGQQVGIAGWQGNVQPSGPGGAHLHLEVKKNGNVWGDWFAAVPYFAGKGVTL